MLLLQQRGATDLLWDTNAAKGAEYRNGVFIKLLSHVPGDFRNTLSISAISILVGTGNAEVLTHTDIRFSIDKLTAISVQRQLKGHTRVLNRQAGSIFQRIFTYSNVDTYNANLRWLETMRLT